MKKLISIVLSAILAIGTFSACGNDVKSVLTDGSTSMEKVIGALGEAFKLENSGTNFTYSPTGS